MKKKWIGRILYYGYFILSFVLWRTFISESPGSQKFMIQSFVTVSTMYNCYEIKDSLGDIYRKAIIAPLILFFVAWAVFMAFGFQILWHTLLLIFAPCILNMSFVYYKTKDVSFLTYLFILVAITVVSILIIIYM